MIEASVPKLSFSDFCTPGHACHLARVTYRPGERLANHDHGFAEIFWIASGEGTHLTPAGQEPLRVGATGVLREGDVHGIKAAWSAAMVLYNVAFPSAHLRELEQRYGPEIASVISRPGGRLIRHLGSSELRSLVSEYERLDRSPRSDIALHAFLIRSLAVIAADSRDEETAEEGTGPIWLRSAIDRLRSEPGRLAGGVPELARLCGRHPDHVNRACRANLGRTASEVVNGLRLDRAEELLRETDASISRIAERSGFSNQSYFFRRFRERTGITPIRFRERHQRPVRMSG